MLRKSNHTQSTADPAIDRWENDGGAVMSHPVPSHGNTRETLSSRHELFGLQAPFLMSAKGAK